MLTKYHPVTVLCPSKVFLGLGVLLFFFLSSSAQEFQFPAGKGRQSLTFKFIKNLIVIPVYVNNKGPYDFVLDTGVGPMIITEPTIIDSIDFKVLRKIKVTGLGIESVEAYVSQNINAKIGRARIEHIPTAILKEDLFNLSGHLGLKVYGLIGYSFFSSFVVDVRYGESRIIFSTLDSKIKYRGRKIPIEIDNLKPYIVAEVALPNGELHKAKFLMDTGASHALSLEMLNEGPFPLPQQKIKANLGMSLSGQIKGYIGRVSQFKIADYVFANIVSGFPDYTSISEKIDITKRNGNVGADLMRRFDVQFNYEEKFIYLKPNRFNKLPFEHDMLGMVIYLDQRNYRRILIGDIDEDSPAEKAGLCPDDEIIGINFKGVDAYSLNDLSEMFKSKADRTLIFEIYRDEKVIFKIVKLEKRI